MPHQTSLTRLKQVPEERCMTVEVEVPKEVEEEVCQEVEEERCEEVVEERCREEATETCDTVTEQQCTTQVWGIRDVDRVLTSSQMLILLSTGAVH